MDAHKNATESFTEERYTHADGTTTIIREHALMARSSILSDRGEIELIDNAQATGTPRTRSAWSACRDPPPSRGRGPVRSVCMRARATPSSPSPASIAATSSACSAHDSWPRAGATFR